MVEEYEKLCFVVGPIGEAETETRNHADWLLDGIIRPVMADVGGFDVVRADQIAAPGMIDAQVIEHLLDAELVIADLSSGNANAFYEIGIRHMIEKPIIHMQLANEKIPFDVSLYRATMFARAHPRDLAKAKEELKQAVEAVLAAGYKVENPVTRSRGQIRLEQSATPEQRVVLEQLRAFNDRLDRVERQSRDISLPKPFTSDAPHTRGGMVPHGVAFEDEIQFVHFLDGAGRAERRRVVWYLSNALPDSNPTEDVGLVRFRIPSELLETEALVSLGRKLVSMPGVKEVSEVPF